MSARTLIQRDARWFEDFFAKNGRYPTLMEFLEGLEQRADEGIQ